MESHLWLLSHFISYIRLNSVSNQSSVIGAQFKEKANESSVALSPLAYLFICMVAFVRLNAMQLRLLHLYSLFEAQLMNV